MERERSRESVTQEQSESILDQIADATGASRYQRFQAVRDPLRAARTVANALNAMVVEKKLYTTMKGKRHLWIEAWTALGNMVGLSPRTNMEQSRWVVAADGALTAYEAYVEVIDVGTGTVVAAAIARCDPDEKLERNDGTTYERWRGPGGGPSRHSIMSMAQTRAASKALSSALRWIVVLQGYEGTSAEEMDVSDKAPAEGGGEDRTISDAQRKRLWAIAFKRAEQLGLSQDDAAEIISQVCEDDLKINKKSIPVSFYDEVVDRVQRWRTEGAK